MQDSSNFKILHSRRLVPENITKLKVGAKKDGRIVAFMDEVYMSAGDSNVTWGGGHCSNPIELYAPNVPHWKSIWYCYKTNALRPGPSRSYMQQEVKWAWENMMDEIAERSWPA